MSSVSLPAVVTAMPSAIAGAGRVPAERGEHRRVALRFDADDLDVGPPRLRRDRHAGDQSAPADRDDEHVEIGRGGEHLQRDGALAGDDRGIVERQHERRAFVVDDAARDVERLLEAVARENYVCSESFRAGDLRERCVARHDDRCPDAEAPRVIRDTLRVVAGRRRDDAVCAPVGWKLQQEVAGAALFERRRELQVLELEAHVGAGDLGEGLRHRRRGLDHCATDALGGVVDVGRGNGEGLVVHRIRLSRSRGSPDA
jgi:hypothetical protein